MGKKSREAITSNLARVLDPPPAPARKRGANLDGLLDAYAPPETQTPGETSTSPQKATPGERPPLAEKTPVQKAPTTPGQIRRPPPERQPLPKTPPVPEPLPWNAPHLRLPHEVIERLRKLRPATRVVVEEIYRAAAGWHSDECVISVGKLALYCNLDEKHVRKHLAIAQAEGLIFRLGDVVGGTDIAARGVRFRCLLPRMDTPPQKATPDLLSPPDKRHPNKRKDLKESSLKGADAPITRLSPEDITTMAATVRDLLSEGQTPEAVEAKFAGGLEAEDWAAVRELAMGREGEADTDLRH